VNSRVCGLVDFVLSELVEFLGSVLLSPMIWRRSEKRGLKTKKPDFIWKYEKNWDRSIIDSRSLFESILVSLHPILCPIQTSKPLNPAVSFNLETLDQVSPY
jgi:hypothetical protein